MFEQAERTGDGWYLQNQWGDKMFLPVDETPACIWVGLLGTGTAHKFNKKYDHCAKLLSLENRPLYVLDTRRDGCGGQGSWSPHEFATVIRSKMPGAQKYAFVHLPAVAPSDELRKSKPAWQEFKRRYDAELPTAAVRVAAAFVESAATRGGLAILICSERHAEDFDSLSQSEQDELYCHRFTLARRIEQELKLHGPDRAFGIKPLRLESVYEPPEKKRPAKQNVSGSN